MRKHHGQVHEKGLVKLFVGGDKRLCHVAVEVRVVGAIERELARDTIHIVVQHGIQHAR